MAEFLIQIVVALPLLLLWYAVVALLLRAFGFRQPFRRMSQNLTFSQYMWLIGVVYWGGGMLIMTTLDDYLDWKYWNGSARNLSAGRLVFHAVLWPLAGLLFGWMTWNTRAGKTDN